MNPGGSTDGAGGARFPRLREPWVPWAILAFVAQVAAFWVISPAPVLPRPTPGPARESFVGDAEDAAGALVLDAWRWLFTPALFVRPSVEDFSGPAWLRGTAVLIEVEAFDVPERPLPWGMDRPGTMVAGQAGRPDPGPAVRWGLPRDSVVIPSVTGVRLPGSARVRVVQGLAGRVIRSGGRPEVESGAFVARPVVVRVGVDPAGELATLPVVWESSDVPEADDAALRAVRGMRFSPVGGGESTDWALVSVEWPASGSGQGVAAPAAPGAATAKGGTP